ncbi:uncharacterized protein LOC124303879 [Neodiprion virginianus]|uniref:uncharacterized protein LOC124303879 n=1 Tax=Neodiprion virginianus TaxID=2961670 RepID=UPI001EE76596|nr:uncharacterized protein LOC124303879 [Neodiprion virginianus]
MILTRSSLILLGLTVFQSIGRANVLAADGAQTCINLCESCGGIATFQHNICQCHVADDNDQGAECIHRMRRQAQELGVDIVSCDLANAEADRPARCAVSPLRRLRTRGNGDLIARYFMGNGLASLLGSRNPEAESTGDSDSSSRQENVGASEATSGDQAEISGDQSNMNSAVVGAPYQFLETDPYMVAAMANWYQPHNMMTIDESCTGVRDGTEMQSFLGQPNPAITSMTDNESGQANFVGSPNQDEIGGVSSGRMYESYNMHPLMLGMNPYAYFIRTPYGVQFPGGSQMLGMQSYHYKSIDGDRNSQSRENNIVGLSPYSNCQTSLLGESNPHLGDSAAGQENSQDKNGMPDEEVTGEANPVGLNREDRQHLGRNGQVDKDVKGDAADPEEIKDQTVGSSKYKLKRRLNRFKTKESRSTPADQVDSRYGHPDDPYGAA